MTEVYDQDYAIRQVSSSSAGGLVIDAHVDVLGNLINASSTVGANPPTQVYQYDSLYRLTASQTGATPPVPLESYSYGKTGDRTSAALNGASATTYAYTPGTHRLQSVGGATRNYDAAGNTQSLNGATLTYDARNRLASVTGSVSATYAYNGKGERASKAVGGVTTTFLYGEGGQLLGEYANGNVQEYLYLDGNLVGVAYATAASPVGQLYYVETDHLGTPRVVIQPGVTSASDIVAWKWDFFGSTFGTNQPSVQGLNLRFPGQYFDAETGLNYNYFRDYEPGTGRYTQPDPIGLRGGGPQLYAYVYSSPLMWPDPTGLKAEGSLCCSYLQKLINTDDASSNPGGVLLNSDYSPVFGGEPLLGLNCCYETKGGPVDADWMLRTAYLGFGRSPIISCGIYAVAKPIWNLANLTNPLANFLNECKRNSCLAASYWLNSGQHLSDMFEPALKKCNGGKCK